MNVQARHYIIALCNCDSRLDASWYALRLKSRNTRRRMRRRFVKKFGSEP